MRELIEGFGLSVLDDARRVESCLNDLIGRYPREVHILAVAARDKSVRELARKIAAGTHNGLWEQVTAEQLGRQFMLATGVAAWALRCWREGVQGALAGGQRDRVDRLDWQVRDVHARVEALMAGGNYQAALRELRDVTVRLPNFDQLLVRCEARVAEAQRICARAGGTGLSSEQRTALYLEALRMCADHDEAQRELAKTPPAPPRSLRVASDVALGRVRLSWPHTQEPGTSFIVMRAEGTAAPLGATSDHRQRRLASTTRTSWEDASPPVGTWVRYAVFSERSGVVSAAAAIAAEPVFMAAEARVTAQPGDGRIELSWTRPANSSGVVISRTTADAPYDPVVITPADADRVIDTGVRNGVRYRYTLRVLYPGGSPGPADPPRQSEGVTCEVIPGAAPEPPGPPAVRVRPPPRGLHFYHRAVELRAAAPPEGEIRILRCETRPTLKPGDGFPERDLGNYGHVVDGQPPVTDRWLSELLTCHYLPVLILREYCYAGHVRRLASSELRDLRMDQRGMTVRVTWTWPTGIDLVLVGWDTEAEPFDCAAAPRTARVSRGDGESAGHYDLAVPRARQVFARVGVVITGDGEEFVSSGIAASTYWPRIHLWHVIRPGRRGRGHRLPTLVLRTDRPARLPALEVRWRRDGQVARRDDGLLMELPAADIHDELPIELPSLPAGSPDSIRVFLADDADSEFFEIVDPPGM